MTEEKKEETCPDKMIVKDLINLNNAITRAMENKDIGLKVSYALNKNYKHIQSILDSFEKAKNNNKRFKEFQEKRIELAKHYSRKDDKGSPIVINKKLSPGQSLPEFDIVEVYAYEQAFNTLKKEYEDVQPDKFLEEVVELEHPIYKISIKEFPMTFNLTFIRAMIKETDAEIEKYLFEESK
jgi:hypothetical protein